MLKMSKFLSVISALSMMFFFTFPLSASSEIDEEIMEVYKEYKYPPSFNAVRSRVEVVIDSIKTVKPAYEVFDTVLRHKIDLTELNVENFAYVVICLNQVDGVFAEMIEYDMYEKITLPQKNRRLAVDLLNSIVDDELRNNSKWCLLIEILLPWVEDTRQTKDNWTVLELETYDNFIKLFPELAELYDDGFRAYVKPFYDPYVKKK